MQRVLSKSFPSIPKRYFSGKRTWFGLIQQKSLSRWSTQIQKEQKRCMISRLKKEKSYSILSRWRAFLSAVSFVYYSLCIATCNGNCICGTCAVKFSAPLHDQTLQSSKEKGLLKRKGKEEGYSSLNCYQCRFHLACQTYIYDLIDGETIEINYCRKYNCLFPKHITVTVCILHHLHAFEIQFHHSLELDSISWFYDPQ